MRPITKNQSGIALVAALVMLVLLTLLAVTMIRTGTLNLRIAQNVQLQQDAEAAAQIGIERVVGRAFFFANPLADPNIPVIGGVGDDQLGGFTVTVDNRECINATPREGDSIGGQSSLTNPGGTIGFENTLWLVTARAEDASSGARATVRQGVGMQMLAGSCD